MKKIILALLATAFLHTAHSQNMLTKKEEKFIKHVASISLLEIKIGGLAETNALAQQVKTTAKRLVDDYTLTSGDITVLASKKGMTLPTQLTNKEQKFYNYFAKKQGKDFDKAYVKCTAKANKKGICYVKKVHKKTNDSDLKDWSAKMLTTLEAHKALLKETCTIAKKVDK